MKFKWWIILLAIASFAGTLLVYPMLPTTIATHWGFNGQVDGTGSRSVQLYIAALPLAMYILLVLIPRIDPRRENYTLHNKAYTIFEAVMVLFLVGLNWATIAYNLGVPVDIHKAVVIPMGILFIVIGNYMGQIRHNYFFGIRTPWTLANEEVWRKTHRLGGYLFTASGLLIVASAFLSGTYSFIITMGAVFLTTIVSVAYSYYVFMDLKKNTGL